MDIVVCGAGRVGQGIAKRLAEDGHDVTIIDADRSLINRVTADLDVRGVTGHAAYPETLKAAGVKSADMIIAVTYSDEVNMMTCQIAHTLFQTPTKIARIRSQSYLDPQWSDLFSTSGMPVDVVISPEVEVGRSILRRLETPGAFFSADFTGGEVKVLGFDVDDDAPIANTALDQLQELFPDLSARVIGIGRKDRLFAPRSNDQLVEGDRVYIAVQKTETDRLRELLGFEETTTRKIVIVGAGNIGLFVASELEKRRTARVRVVEADLARAEYSAAELQRAIVIHGDALNQDILEEAGVPDADVVIGLTNDDKINLLLSAMAKRMGAKKSIALVNSADLVNIRSNLDVDVVVDPRAVTISQILLRLRRGRILALNSLEGGRAEVAEGIVFESSELVDKSLDYESLPDGMVAGSLSRFRDEQGHEILQISQSTRVRVGDHVVLLFERDMVKRVEKMFRMSPDFVQ